MKMNRSLLTGLVVGVAALAVSSCAYDPYYSGTSYSSSYGHGYGNSSFSTSVFVSTGNPRWGYDPYSGCYFDYTRRTYYDPYLYGYYPIGYRPRYVYGAPHPGGWTQGRSYCPPPSTIHSHTLTDYSNRAERYRSLDNDWASNVRVSAPASHRREDYGGRETSQHNSQGLRGTIFPQRQETVPPRGGFFQRSSDEMARGSLGRGVMSSRGFTPTNTAGRATEPTTRAGNDESGRAFSGRQESIERPTPEQRIEPPTSPRQPEARPEGLRGGLNRGGNPGGGGGDPRGRGRGIRGLGEG